MIAYKRHEWVDNDVIDTEKLNNIEQGISEAKKAAESAQVNIDSLRKQLSELVGNAAEEASF